jgi:TolB protein
VSTDIGAVSARWSPDGGWIAFTSRFRSNPQVWIVHPDGTGLAKVTDGSDGSNAVAPVWSPDGTDLLFAQTKDDQSSLWMIHPDGTAPTHLTDGAGQDWHIWLPAPHVGT